ncbi:MAG: hypothetical protein ACE5R6_16920, partial [Candidatus Heimdallarchaeota archaeon]
RVKEWATPLPSTRNFILPKNNFKTIFFKTVSSIKILVIFFFEILCVIGNCREKELDVLIGKQLGRDNQA